MELNLIRSKPLVSQTVNYEFNKVYYIYLNIYNGDTY